MRHMDIARAELGTHEVDGATANPRIMEYFRTCGGDWAKDDSTPWCGAFCGWVMTRAGLDLPKEPLRARSWATWGEPLAAFEPGCVVVTTRGNDPASGHVTLGDSMVNGKIMGLGGNQGDAVSIVGIDSSRVIAYRRVPGATPPPAPSIGRTAVKSETVRNAGYAGAGIAAMTADEATGVVKQTIEGVQGVFGPGTSVHSLIDLAKSDIKWLFVFVVVASIIGVVSRRFRATEEGKIG